MEVGLWFIVGFLIGGCTAGTVMCCSLLKHVAGRKSKND